MINEKTLARGLGWFSIGLGLVEVFGTDALAAALGMEKSKTLLRIYGFREIAVGAVILTQKQPTAIPLWARAGGDALDIATLAVAARGDNPKRGAVGVAIGAVAGVAAFDAYCAAALSAGAN